MKIKASNFLLWGLTLLTLSCAATYPEMEFSSLLDSPDGGKGKLALLSFSWVVCGIGLFFKRRWAWVGNIVITCFITFNLLKHGVEDFGTGAPDGIFYGMLSLLFSIPLLAIFVLSSVTRRQFFPRLTSDSNRDNNA